MTSWKSDPRVDEAINKNTVHFKFNTREFDYDDMEYYTTYERVFSNEQDVMQALIWLHESGVYMPFGEDYKVTIEIFKGDKRIAKMKTKVIIVPADKCNFVQVPNISYIPFHACDYCPYSKECRFKPNRRILHCGVWATISILKKNNASEDTYKHYIGEWYLCGLEDSR